MQIRNYLSSMKVMRKRDQILNSIVLCAIGFSFGSGLSTGIGKRPMEIVAGTALFATVIILCAAFVRRPDGR